MKRLSCFCCLALFLLDSTALQAADGTPLWTNYFNASRTSDDRPQSIAVDAYGNVCVTGVSMDSGTFFNYATVKYSSAGAPLWTNIFNATGSGDAEPTSIVSDVGGNIYVTGFAFAGGNMYDYDFATIKYSGAGVPLWTNRFNRTGNGQEEATALAVDPSGNVYVTGNSNPSSFVPADYATVKYSNTGTPLWTNFLTETQTATTLPCPSQWTPWAMCA